MLVSAQESHTDNLLQIPDCLTERRLSHVEPKRSLSEVQFFRDRDKLGKQAS
ncbi:hypothetical protein GCM10010985_60830 [Caballeronia grimmiae]|uniref:Uncharacterized protein n=1 Tax=Caballeronia grimmiae TaxID=1071679 RepID=A0ABQ1SBM6_9BURK|nr:hypothetical protein GCM10010985_60830 [Caballeronia grimmiae]